MHEAARFTMAAAYAGMPARALWQGAAELASLALGAPISPPCTLKPDAWRPHLAALHPGAGAWPLLGAKRARMCEPHGHAAACRATVIIYLGRIVFFLRAREWWRPLLSSRSLEVQSPERARSSTLASFSCAFAGAS